MKLCDYLTRERILLDLEPGSKTDVIEELTRRLLASGLDTDVEKLNRLLLAREDLRTTAIGNHIALPHTTFEALSETNLLVGVCPGGTDFESIDGDPVRLFILMVGPENERSIQLRLLARISRIMSPRVVDRLVASESPDALYAALVEEEDALG